jgi:hypothetical protein
LHPEVDEFVQKTVATGEVLTKLLYKWLPNTP